MYRFLKFYFPKCRLTKTENIQVIEKHCSILIINEKKLPTSYFISIIYPFIYTLTIYLKRALNSHMLSLFYKRTIWTIFFQYNQFYVFSLNNRVK